MGQKQVQMNFKLKRINSSFGPQKNIHLGKNYKFSILNTFDK